MTDNENININNEQEPQKPVEIGEIITTVDAKITKETFLEFANFQSGPLKLLKQNLLICVFVCLLIYMLKKNNSEPIEVLATMGYYCLFIIGLSFVLSLLNRFVLSPRQYEKSGFSEIKLKVSFTTAGIYQTISIEEKESSALIHWENIARCVETENSYFFMTQRRACILSKEGFGEENVSKITELIKNKLGEIKYKKK